MTNILKERLDKGPVICAEGFLFEIERRGYMASGGRDLNLNACISWGCDGLIPPAPPARELPIAN